MIHKFFGYNGLRKNGFRYLKDLKNRKRMSEIRKKWYKDNPKKAEILQKNRIKVLKSNYFRKLRSEQQKEYFKNNPNKKEELSEKLKKIMRSPEMRKKKSKALKEFKKKNPLMWKKIEKKRMKTVKSKEYRKKRSYMMKKYHKEHPEARKNQASKLSKWIKNNPDKWKIATNKSAKTRRSLEFRKKVSKTVKKFLKDNPKFRIILKERARNMWKNEGTIKKILKNKDLKPNKSELKLIQICKDMHLPYKYVGDFKIILDGRNPDFININGKKKLIELFGKFWHSEKARNMTVKSHIRDRKEHFKKLGYDTLIIWDYELKNPEKVSEKIKVFENK